MHIINKYIREHFQIVLAEDVLLGYLEAQGNHHDATTSPQMVSYLRNYNPIPSMPAAQMCTAEHQLQPLMQQICCKTSDLPGAPRCTAEECQDQGLNLANHALQPFCRFREELELFRQEFELEPVGALPLGDVPSS